MAIITAIKNYFIEAYQEISKVVWPSRDEIVRYTILVIIISLVLAAFLGAVDYIFKLGVEEIISF